MTQNSFQQLITLLLAKWQPSFLPRISWVGTKIRLEASSKCQLKCPLCITGTGITRTQTSVGWGYLKLDDFKKIIEQNPRIREIELSNYGEIMLNPELPAMLEFAFQKNIRLSAINGVNLNHLPDTLAEALVKYQFYKMKVSVDGASEETYQIYRKGGKFSEVIANIQKINHYKKLYNSELPKLKWQFIIFGHNEHELPEARQIAKSLDMSFKAKLNYKPKVFPVQNPEFVLKESGIGVSDIRDFESKHQTLYSPACLQLWTEPQVNWDGKLLGCCVNNFGDFGNVFESGLENCLNSEKYRYAKAMVLGQKPPRKDIPCTRCKRYQKVKEMPFAKVVLKSIEKKLFSFL